MAKQLLPSVISRIQRLHKEGLKISEIAVLVGHDVKTVAKYAQMNRIEVARLGRPPQHSTQRILIERFVEAALKRIPTLYLHELQYMIQRAFALKLSIPTIFRIKKKLHFRRIRGSLINRFRRTDRVKRMRTLYCQLLARVDPDLLVFIDETLKDSNNTTRVYANVQRGSDFENSIIPERNSTSVSSIVAICNRRVIHWFSKTQDGDSAINADDVHLFLEQLVEIVPRNALLVLDNARVHRNENVEQFLRESGINYIFTAPYSPDLSPIEFLFSWLKNRIRSYENSGHENIRELIDVILERETTPELLRSFYHHCQTKWASIAQTD